MSKLNTRLDKFISENTDFSRSEAVNLIKHKQVKINTQIVKSGSLKISEKDIVFINDKKIEKRDKYVYFLMNKPNGIVSARSDGRDGTVVDLLPEKYKKRKISPAGRLDKDTTGLLILTDDGDFIHRFISPRTHASKVYMATLEEPYDSSYEDKFAAGMTLANGEKCVPAEIAADSENPKKCFIKLTEGKYHQVKRMIAACGNKVTELERIAIGNYVISPKIKRGDYVVFLHKDMNRFLTNSDLFFLIESYRQNFRHNV